MRIETNLRAFIFVQLFITIQLQRDFEEVFKTKVVCFRNLLLFVLSQNKNFFKVLKFRVRVIGEIYFVQDGDRKSLFNSQFVLPKCRYEQSAEV